MPKKARFGDWTVGNPQDSEAYNVSYSLVAGNGVKFSGTIKCFTTQGPEGAGRIVHKRLSQRWPDAGSISIRKVWKPGFTPSGIALPPGTEWVDDEVTGKKQNP